MEIILKEVNIFLQSQTVNILGFATHTVSVKTTHLCYSTKAATNKM